MKNKEKRLIFIDIGKQYFDELTEFTNRVAEQVLSQEGKNATRRDNFSVTGEGVVSSDRSNSREKQVEEMAKVMQKCYEKNGLLNFKWLAESAYKCLTKDSVVISKEEYESLKNEPVSIFKNYQEMVKFYGEEVRNLKAKNEELKNQLVKKCKETAEKLLSELYYIARFYYGSSANVLAWAKEKAKQLGIEIKE